MPRSYEDYIVMEALDDFDGDTNEYASDDGTIIQFDPAEEILYSMSIEYKQEKTWNKSISRK